MFAFKCPRCGRDISVREEIAGKLGRCPACNSTVQIPHLEIELLQTAPEPMLANDPVQVAMKHFEIPGGYEHFLFCLPLYYVAKSDGSVSMKETFSIGWNSLMSGMIRPAGPEKAAYQMFARNQVLKFMGKTDLTDFKILVDAIQSKLSQYPPHEAQRIRKAIHDSCVHVAKASGPWFRDKIIPAEREMLDKIFADI